MQFKILVTDDEVNLRTTLAKILETANYAVKTAANPQEALKYLQAETFDLAFLDLRMPDMDGLTLLAEIRGLFPDMPVLILTAHASLESAMEAVRRGARDYLLKPVDPDIILARVKEVVSELEQPARRREIVSSIQSLLSELQQINGGDFQSTNLLSALPPTDPSRFLQRGPFTVDLHARHVILNDDFIPLSPSNFDYLVTLLRHSPNPVSYEVLVKESQGYEMTRIEAQEMARWRIHELRKAIEPVPGKHQHIITVRGQGYRLVT